MKLCDFVGSIGCAVASLPLLIMGNLIEGIGVLTDLDILSNGGRSIADFSDLLMEIGEETMFSQEPSPLGRGYAVPAEYFGCRPVKDSSTESDGGIA